MNWARREYVDAQIESHERALHSDYDKSPWHNNMQRRVDALESRVQAMAADYIKVVARLENLEDVLTIHVDPPPPTRATPLRASEV